STQSSPVAFGTLRRRVMVLAPGQPIHHDHFSSDDSSSSSSSETSSDSSADALSDSASSHSSSDHSSPTPSLGMRPSHHLCSLVPSIQRSFAAISKRPSHDSSSDSFADALSDSASICSSSDHSLPASPSGTRPSHHLCSLVPSIHRSSTAISERPSHDSSSASPSRKRSRSLAASVLLSSPTLGAFSYTRANLLPSPKRIRRPETATNLEGCSKDSFKPYVPREAGWGVDFEDESSESSRSRGTDLEMDVDVERSDGIEIYLEVQVEIEECFAYE
ncbi:hypothetical protein Tco_0112961, partial [Tanacetum coccineum]